MRKQTKKQTDKDAHMYPWSSYQIISYPQGTVLVKEVPCFQESLDSDDVFIFDAGLDLYQVLWNIQVK